MSFAVRRDVAKGNTLNEFSTGCYRGEWIVANNFVQFRGYYVPKSDLLSVCKMFVGAAEDGFVLIDEPVECATYDDFIECLTSTKNTKKFKETIVRYFVINYWNDKDEAVTVIEGDDGIIEIRVHMDDCDEIQTVDEFLKQMHMQIDVSYERNLCHKHE